MMRIADDFKTIAKRQRELAAPRARIAEFDPEERERLIRALGVKLIGLVGQKLDEASR